MSKKAPQSQIVFEPSGYLRITPERYDEWKELVDAGGVIWWNRKGIVRIVPNAVLDNALRVYRQHVEMMEAGRISEIPSGVTYVDWEQAKAEFQAWSPINPA